MKLNKFKTKRLNRRGSTLAELGPALLLILLFLVFPIINLLGLGMTYFSCNVLNDLQLRQACLVSAEEARSDKGPVKMAVAIWQSNGLGQFVNPVTPPETTLEYRDGTTYDDNKKDVYVVVTTKTQCRPFINMPMFQGIPGLGSPVVLTIQKEGFCEHPTVLATTSKGN